MINKMIVITGKTGVGKTTLLKQLDFSNIIFLDDVVKKEMYIKGSKVFEGVVNLFGNDIVVNNKIDTKALGKIVLSDKKKFNELEKITIPALKKYLMELKQKGTFIVEAAIYINHEKEFENIFDYVVLVKTDKENPENKFEYMNKKIQLINDIDIKYDKEINSDEQKALSELKSELLKVIS